MNTQASIVKEDIKKLNNKIEKYRVISKYLATMNKNREVYQNYKKCNAFKKKQFYSRYEGDILSYEHAMERMEQLNIKFDTPLDKIVSLVNEYKLQVDVLLDNFNAIERRIEMIRSAKEIVNKVRDKDFYIEVGQKSREESL